MKNIEAKGSHPSQATWPHVETHPGLNMCPPFPAHLRSWSEQTIRLTQSQAQLPSGASCFVGPIELGRGIYDISHRRSFLGNSKQAVRKEMPCSSLFRGHWTSQTVFIRSWGEWGGFPGTWWAPRTTWPKRSRPAQVEASCWIRFHQSASAIVKLMTWRHSPKYLWEIALTLTLKDCFALLVPFAISPTKVPDLRIPFFLWDSNLPKLLV